MRRYLKDSLVVLERRHNLFVIFNILFFTIVFFSALIISFLLPPPLAEGTAQWMPSSLFGADWLSMFLGIFLFNLLFCSVITLVLSGLAIFILPAALLSYRAFLWGMLIAFVPSWQFLLALPTLVLEAEAYVLASVVGTTLGLSWLRPSLVFRGEPSRLNALKQALREAAHICIFVVLLLLIAAIIETITIQICR